MWEFQHVDGFARSLKKFAKRHRQEAINAIDNGQAYLTALNSGLTVQQIVRGYIHEEPHGIKAFDENGPGAHKKGDATLCLSRRTDRNALPDRDRR